MTKLDTARNRAISEREEERIREELMLLQYRNSSSPYKLQRLYERYMKCIHTKENQDERTKKKRQT